MATPERSFGDKLLGFFIKEAPGTNVSESPAPPATMNPGTNTLPPISIPGVSKADAPPTGTQAGGTVDTKFVDHFAGVLSKANLQGPDYFEFREILRNLGNLGLSEDKQFQAAWASFKAMAGTGDPGMLTSAANQYLTALGTDRDAFLKSVDTAIQDRVGGLQAEQKKLETDNEAIARQIAELQQRVNGNTDRLSKIGGEISEQSTRINQNRANFETTYSSFTDQIKADISKIAAYLK